MDQNGRKAARGCFVPGQLRTIKSILEDHAQWKSATSHMSEKAARAELQKFNSVEARPLDIFPSQLLDVPLLLFSPPDPLHCIRYTKFFATNTTVSSLQ